MMEAVQMHTDYKGGKMGLPNWGVRIRKSEQPMNGHLDKRMRLNVGYYYIA